MKIAASWKSTNMHLLLPPEFVGDRAHFFMDGPDGGYAIVSVGDVSPVLEDNQAQRLHNDGYSEDRSVRRVASVPQAIRDKWLQEEGWDAYRPDLYPHQLAAKFNDPDWMGLRTADGRVGVINGVLR